MKIADVLESGIAGATTFSLLQEALQNSKDKNGAPLLHKSGTLRKLRKGNKHGHQDKELYVKLAGELMGHAALFGLAGLGKKKNAVLRGGLLGAAAGLGVAFLEDETDEQKNSTGIDANGRFTGNAVDDATTDKIITVILYSLGGVLAGMAVKALKSKKVKKRKWAKPLKKMKKVKAAL